MDIIIQYLLLICSIVCLLGIAYLVIGSIKEKIFSGRVKTPVQNNYENDTVPDAEYYDKDLLMEGIEDIVIIGASPHVRLRHSHFNSVVFFDKSKTGRATDVDNLFEKLSETYKEIIDPLVSYKKAESTMRKLLPLRFPIQYILYVLEWDAEADDFKVNSRLSYRLKSFYYSDAESGHNFMLAECINLGFYEHDVHATKTEYQKYIRKVFFAARRFLEDLQKRTPQ